MGIFQVGLLFPIIRVLNYQFKKFNIFKMCFNCEHLLFVNIVKEKQNNRGFYKKKFRVFFLNLMKIKFCWRLVFEGLNIHKPSLWSRKVPQTIWARSVQQF